MVRSFFCAHLYNRCTPLFIGKTRGIDNYCKNLLRGVLRKPKKHLSLRPIFKNFNNNKLCL